MSGAGLVEEILTRLQRRHETLAVAESLTGGLLASTVVDVPGASRVFRGGFVAYATDLKGTLLGVPVDLLSRRGPVDPDVASAMACGARVRCAADWGLATTGVAGPDPQDGHGVGTVWIAVADGDGTRVRGLVLGGDRGAVRSGAVGAAFGLLAERLRERCGG